MPCDRQELSVNPPKTVRDNASRLRRLNFLSDLLDTRFAVPGTKWRFGLDGLLGLLPVVGDSISWIISAYMLGEAASAGVRKRTLIRMFWNITVDYVVGLIPLVGDIFDFAFKANRRNLELINRDLLSGNKNNSPTDK
ncbi:MAG TPA: DUF4112 domain-containing protein [Alphaproteobacteria bacterium]|nr:DUF4112 domain-containing protein [Alphaproteobacteria bacterium]HCO91421.1 DUF4112 domain-containing protein [Alphaproteobacteria bacterium]